MSKGYYEKLRVTVGGDPVGGFMVDVHDGQSNLVYCYDGGTQNDAVTKALAAHAKAAPDAPTESDYVPVEEATPVDEANTTTEGAAPAVSEGNTQPAETTPAG